MSRGRWVLVSICTVFLIADVVWALMGHPALWLTALTMAVTIGQQFQVARRAGRRRSEGAASRASGPTEG